LENNPLELLGKKQGTVILLLLLLALAIFLLPSGGDGDKENTADLESKTAELCSSVSGVGECRVMLTYRDDEVYAVAVVCEGANSTSVRRDITELISSLFGIGANRVQILLLE
jgi:hypothetical protein